MRRQRFAILNLTLLLLLVVAPVMAAGRVVAQVLFVAMFTLVLISAVYAVGSRWHARWIVLPLAVLASSSQILDLGLDAQSLAVLTEVLGTLTLMSVIVLIARHLFTVKAADYETINAAVCVYLLMGVLWSMMYSTTELLSPGSFAYPLMSDPTAAMKVGDSQTIFPLYYSFVTMTTLGYGDIVPVGAAARMLTVGQAILGQVYLVVIVARLVGLQVSGETAGLR